MSLSKSAEKRMLTAEEFETVSGTHYPEIRELTRKQLSDLVRRLREHRDKARDVARQQRREMRGKSEPRGATPAADNTGTAIKSEIFAGAVKRLNREIARHDQAERRSAQGAKSRSQPAPGRTARATRPKPTKEPAAKPPAKKAPARRERKS